MRKKYRKVNEGRSDLKISKVNCGLGCLCFIPAGDHCVLFLGQDSASHFPGVQLMGTVKLNAWSGEGEGRIKLAMDYAIPSGEVFVFNPGPSCY